MPVWNEPVITKHNGKISIAFEAQSPSAENSSVIIAVKDGVGVLQQVYIAQKNSEDGKIKFVAENIAAAGTDKITAFFWCSLSDLVPLKAALPVKIDNYIENFI